jgi:hypothetical protein
VALVDEDAREGPLFDAGGLEQDALGAGEEFTVDLDVAVGSQDFFFRLRPVGTEIVGQQGARFSPLAVIDLGPETSCKNDGRGHAGTRRVMKMRRDMSRP